MKVLWIVQHDKGRPKPPARGIQETIYIISEKLPNTELP